MWTYRQVDGAILHDGEQVGTGYSGYDPDPSRRGEPGEGKNNPSKQYEKSVGPLPVGRYRIGKPFSHPTKGPLVMRLAPLAGTDTRGRGNFLIHGDSVRRPGTASLGCIVASRHIRATIAAGVERGDDLIDVV